MLAGAEGGGGIDDQPDAPGRYAARVMRAVDEIAPGRERREARLVLGQPLALGHPLHRDPPPRPAPPGPRQPQYRPHHPRPPPPPRPAPDPPPRPLTRGTPPWRPAGAHRRLGRPPRPSSRRRRRGPRRAPRI